jgi:hypothetical protein
MPTGATPAICLTEIGVYIAYTYSIVLVLDRAALVDGIRICALSQLA